MIAYREMSAAALAEEYARAKQAYEAAKAKGLALDMSRGKPGREQLDLVSGLLTALDDPADCFDGSIDVRNYGNLLGIPSARALFADLLGVRPSQVIVGGNASLTLMYDTISKAFTHGLLHSEKPWSKQDGLKFLCPAPGYDRHFRVSESFGMTLLTIPMTPAGPDMDAVEAAVQDPAVKGMWCTPKYSNPDGIVYSDATIARIAALKPAAPDFALMWDNAYCVHEFAGDFVPFADMLSLSATQGNADMVYEFASTSKITFPGAGISCMAMSEANVAHFEKLMSVQLISADKVNQLRHVRYLVDKAHVLSLMQAHAAILGPKFATVLDSLETEIAPLGIASWQRPKGGYFVSFNALPGTAARIHTLCKEAGVIMTEAGATYPYGIDPADSNLRIAPTLPSPTELAAAMEVFCLCVRLAALERLMAAA